MMKALRSVLGKSRRSDAASPGEDKANKDITKAMRERQFAEERTVNLLLLGAGGSGKSTVVKQMVRIHHGELTGTDRLEAVNCVRLSIVEDVMDLVKHSAQLEGSHPECRLRDDETTALRDSLFRRLATPVDAVLLNPYVAQTFTQLWADPGMQATYEIRAKSQGMDNLPYLVPRLTTIADPSYDVDFDDYVRTRQRTTGVVHTSFSVQHKDAPSTSYTVNITDVGGQRNERKKWIHCFAGVNAVIYIVSLAAYDQVVFEDHRMSRWAESLTLFGNTTGLEHFDTTSFIVFLNKEDLFRAKLPKVNILDFHPEIPEDQADQPEKIIKTVTAWFREAFEATDLGDLPRPPQEIMSRQHSAQSSSASPSGGVGHEMPPTASIHRHDYSASLNSLSSETRKGGGKKTYSNGRHLMFHVTCATDTNQIQRVMSAVQFNTLQRVMQESGLL